MYGPFWTTVHCRWGTSYTCPTDSRTSETFSILFLAQFTDTLPATSALNRCPYPHPRTRHPANIQLYWAHIRAGHSVVRAALPETRGP